MEHYFSSKTNAEHKYIEIEYSVKNITIRLTTDSGVFSRNSVDFGSNLLIKSVPELNDNILDLGCGYGPVGISMAKLNPNAQVLMADINERAVELSKKI